MLPGVAVSPVGGAGGVGAGGPDSDVTAKSSNSALVLEVAAPMLPELNWLSVTVNSSAPFTYPHNCAPTTSILSVYHVPVVTVKDFEARVVVEPPTSFLNSNWLLLLS